MELLAFEWLGSPQVWGALLTLTALEMVLGLDNILFLAIITDRLPAHRQAAGRRIGLTLAVGARLLLLATLSLIVTLTRPVLPMFGRQFSWRDLVFIGGGLYLLVKAIHEIHDAMEGDADAGADSRDGGDGDGPVFASFAAAVMQIALIDIIFSLDAVVAAAGMADLPWVMVVAVLAAMVLTLLASTSLARFVAAHPTIRMLVLAFLMLTGVFLIADGFGLHIPKDYLYFALAFLVVVESLNHWLRQPRRAR